MHQEAPISPPQTPEVLRKLGRYELLRRLAVGGMGEIYLARFRGAAGFEKRCVIKKILPRLAQEKEFVEKFADEGRILVQLSHGNIVPIFEMGEVNNELFMAMEYIEGKDLRTILKGLRAKKDVLPAILCVHVIAEVCKGLAHAHQKNDERGVSLGIIHRDISPSNILISKEGEVKLVDFGIAKASFRNAKSVTGRLQGKFSYMSPEQARGASLDPRSDLFSTGVVLYEMLTGERPFWAPSDLATLDRVREARYQPLESHRPKLNIPLEMDAVLGKALALNPEERYPSAQAMLSALIQLQISWGVAVTASTLVEHLGPLLSEEFSSSLKFEHALEMEAELLLGNFSGTPGDATGTISLSIPRAPFDPSSVLPGFSETLPLSSLTPGMGSSPPPTTPISFEAPITDASQKIEASMPPTNTPGALSPVLVGKTRKRIVFAALFLGAALMFVGMVFVDQWGSKSAPPNPIPPQVQTDTSSETSILTTAGSKDVLTAPVPTPEITRQFQVMVVPMRTVTLFRSDGSEISHTAELDGVGALYELGPGGYTVVVKKAEGWHHCAFILDTSSIEEGGVPSEKDVKISFNGCELELSGMAGEQSPIVVSVQLKSITLKKPNQVSDPSKDPPKDPPKDPSSKPYVRGHSRGTTFEITSDIPADFEAQGDEQRALLGVRKMKLKLDSSDEVSVRVKPKVKDQNYFLSERLYLRGGKDAEKVRGCKQVKKNAYHCLLSFNDRPRLRIMTTARTAEGNIDQISSEIRVNGERIAETSIVYVRVKKGRYEVKAKTSDPKREGKAEGIIVGNFGGKAHLTLQ